ncbi:FkbM family methyltransferase [Candidatus Methylobacter oryzae]|uniref:FkbM family methyltransferase n=1 Tax=Candidatus Methylobacter oryzae TaxID=2497749 RepID=A0ABY3CEW0_9GAMM|nr:FkbM family methyltransferase [Candidatus Methylobacter oryzae]TRX01776.1 FkbM family methyltransferase [Candidatus Methylobacter oryzae]
MKYQALLNRLDKLTQALLSKRLIIALLLHRVLAGSEHRHILSKDLLTIIDIGANRGQFALAARQWTSKAHVVSFEPLPGPAAVFRRVFTGDSHVVLHQAAIGPEPAIQKMHVSARDDSSSLLPISPLQATLFPGTEEIATTEVRVAPLDEFVSAADLQSPAMLKLDVQGFEFDALRGCESLLGHFEWIYCECSFVELYSKQKLAAEIIDWLSCRGFHLIGMFNPAYNDRGQAVQADFLFSRNRMIDL